MRRRVVKRLHSEDARMLRQMFFDLMGRIYDLEASVGALQKAENVGGSEVEVIESKEAV